MKIPLEHLTQEELEGLINHLHHFPLTADGKNIIVPKDLFFTSIRELLNALTRTWNSKEVQAAMVDALHRVDREGGFNSRTK